MSDFWTDTRVERLRAHVAAKHSAAAAAADLGCGRGAAVNKAARMGLTFASQKPKRARTPEAAVAPPRRQPTPAAIRLAVYDPIVARAIAA